MCIWFIYFNTFFYRCYINKKKTFFFIHRIWFFTYVSKHMKKNTSWKEIENVTSEVLRKYKSPLFSVRGGIIKSFHHKYVFWNLFILTKLNFIPCVNSLLNSYISQPLRGCFDVYAIYISSAIIINRLHWGC